MTHNRPMELDPLPQPASPQTHSDEWEGGRALLAPEPAVRYDPVSGEPMPPIPRMLDLNIEVRSLEHAEAIIAAVRAVV